MEGGSRTLFSLEHKNELITVLRIQCKDQTKKGIKEERHEITEVMKQQQLPVVKKKEKWESS